jgi:hypothetical protein
MKAMGVELDKQALPQQVHCPLCQRFSLVIQRDWQCHGQWYACTHCQFAGDAIDLIMAVKNVPHAAAFRFLAELAGGLPGVSQSEEDIAMDWEVYGGRRRKITQFMADSVRPTAAHETPAAEALLLKLGLADRAQRDNWPQRGGKLIGFSDRTSIEKLITEGTVAYRQRGVGKDHHITGWHMRSVFRGAGWQAVVIIPCWDLLYRVHGFIIIGREGGEQDVTYACALGQFHCALATNPAGVAFMLAVEHGPGTAVFATPDIMFAIRLHLTNFDNHEDFLPLVCGIDQMKATTRHAWAMIRPSRLIHFDTNRGANAFRQARNAGGKVANPILGYSGYAPRSIMSAMAMTQSTLPYLDALEQQIASRSAAEAAALVLEIGMSKEELTKFIACANPTTQDRLSPLIDEMALCQTVVCWNRAVHETNEGWFSARSGMRPATLITDMRLRIDRVVWQPKRERSVYCGRIIFHDQDIPFTALAKDFDHNPFAWMRDHLIRLGVGVPYYDPSWVKYVIPIAQLFQPPKMVTGRDMVGWDTTDGFIFPEYIQRGDGTVETPGVALSTHVAPPCQHFEPPDDTPNKFQRLIDQGGDELPILIDVMTYVVTQALRQENHKHLLLVGDMARRVGYDAADACGCRGFKVYFGESFKTNQLIRLASEHNWPSSLVLANTNFTERLFRFAARLSFPWIAAANSLAALLVRIRDGGHELRCLADASGIRKFDTTARQILPHYLKHICETDHMVLQDPTIQRVITSICDWLNAPNWIRSSARTFLHVDSPIARVDAFFELVAKLYTTGTIPAVRRGDLKERSNDRDLVLLDNGRLFVPAVGINKELKAKFGESLDLELVEARFNDIKEQCTILKYGKTLGWMIPEAWWRRKLEQFSNQESESASC